MRSTVEGLMDALRAQECVKERLRLPSGSVRSQHSNPLKAAADVDDALHDLLLAHDVASRSPSEAFDDALRELREYQAALFGAARFAFESMLAKFDPDVLQEAFDQQTKKGAILGMPAKLRYWELYRQRYAAAARDADAAFRTLFGDAFALAYAEQLERLRTHERNGP